MRVAVDRDRCSAQARGDDRNREPLPDEKRTTYKVSRTLTEQQKP